jgi:hypothetical protein
MKEICKRVSKPVRWAVTALMSLAIALPALTSVNAVI